MEKCCRHGGQSRAINFVCVSGLKQNFVSFYSYAIYIYTKSIASGSNFSIPTACTLTAQQRRRRHFKCGQATANKRSLVHVHEGGGGGGGGGLQQVMCGSKNCLWNQIAAIQKTSLT